MPTRPWFEQPVRWASERPPAPSVARAADRSRGAKPGSQAPLDAAQRDQPFLLIRNLGKVFDGGGEAPVRAVDNVSLAIRHGEIFVLLGSSGCGKSTLLRLLAGFETPTEGTIELAGQDIAALPPYARPISMMFQSYALFPHLSVWDNVAFGLRRARLPRAEIAQRVGQLLELVQLQGYARRKPDQLSGGQQQRVALARSLARRPQLLLLDEPLGALDKKLRERTQVELAHIIEQVGVTCLMVTHDQLEAMSMASRVAVMDEGRILQVGAPRQVYENPNSRFVADFIGSVNLFEGGVAEDEADHVIVDTPECRHYVSHGIGGAGDARVTLAVRPEKIVLQARDRGMEGRFNRADGVIETVSYFGSETLYHVRLATGMLLKASRANTARREDARLARGAQVSACWDGSDIVVLRL